jgi:hypothetical protein
LGTAGAQLRVNDLEHEFDVALSFAGEDRGRAEAMAELLVARNLRVFYDRYEQAALWGKDLYQHLQTVYRDRAKFCVIFTSKHYAEKLWTKHELRQAQARAFSENIEYILPLKLDDTEIPGINPTVGYVDLRLHTIQHVADMLSRKVRGDSDAMDELNWKGDLVEFNGTQVAAYWPRRVELAQGSPTFPLVNQVTRIR